MNMPNQHLQSSALSALSTLNSLVDNHFECSICLDTFKGPSVIQECLHHFCDTCIKESIQQCSKECPACRARITSRRDLRKDHLVGIIVSKVVVARLVLPCEQLLLPSCVVCRLTCSTFTADIVITR
jgi:hypothetical protein